MAAGQSQISIFHKKFCWFFGCKKKHRKKNPTSKTSF